MRNDPRNLMPGDRVLVWDALNHGPVGPATIVARYGYHPFWTMSWGFGLRDEIYPGGYEVWKYPDLVDVRFDRRPDVISHGHFTSGVEELITSKALGVVERDFHAS